jgi:hypothetical protein
MQTGDWEQRVAGAWASIGDREEAEFRTLIDDLAVPLYRQALDAGVAGERRRRAVIQVASWLRNLDRSQESVALLTAELGNRSDHLDDAFKTVLALALTAGRRAAGDDHTGGLHQK